jgi:hypothetical protein
MAYDTETVRREIAGMDGYNGKVKDVIGSALKRVGRQTYGKYDIDSYANWKWNAVDTPQPLNCWASVVFWAWHGNAIRSDWPRRYTEAYTSQVVGYMQNSPVVTLEKQDVARAYLLGRLTASVIATVTSPTADVTAPPGRTIFFRSRHTGPLAHVALTLGGKYVVSNWRLPNAVDNDHLKAGYVHIETIARLAAYVDPTCEVSITPKPFWDLRMSTMI